MGSTPDVECDAGIFAALESEVRSYCRSWPVVFDRALDSRLYDENGRPYLDFFTGAGALNYGHNNPVLKQALLGYLGGDHVVHSLDMFTVAKREFLATLDDVILQPRGLEYRVQFPGPGGANAVEAALKLARKVTGRTEVICFSGGFHGTTLGALAVTGNRLHRGGAGISLEHAIPMPFDRSTDEPAPDFTLFDWYLEEAERRGERPAAAIVETVQGEGGVNVSSAPWLRALSERCRRKGIVLIVDDIQMGCGRTGPFFSFEIAGITPDIVCLSKSISGYGAPLALTLIRPDLDLWEPGEHNGTFRGFDPAFVTGTAALRAYWQDDALERSSIEKGGRIGTALSALVASIPHVEIESRGRGMVHGLAFAHAELAREVSATAFALGLLVETAGPEDEVVKLMPALTISDSDLDEGLALLADAVHAVC